MDYLDKINRELKIKRFALRCFCNYCRIHFPNSADHKVDWLCMKLRSTPYEALRGSPKIKEKLNS